MSTCRWLLVLPFIYACGMETVAHRQSEPEANRIVLVLEREGVRTQKRIDSNARRMAFDVLVPIDQRVDAYRLLEKHGLPRRRPLGTEELVEDKNLIPTQQQETARAELAVMGDIENKLVEWPMITHAHATASLPRAEPLAAIDAPQPRPKVSVVLQYRGERPPVDIESVRAFVQARVPGVAAPDVSVELLPNESARLRDVPVAPRCAQTKRLLGVEVCAGDARRAASMLIVALTVAGAFALLSMLAVRRAISYRQEITRLTKTRR